MFPNDIVQHKLSRQRGFLLPLALFIIVVMGVLAITISRTSIQTQTSSIQEFTNIQAFYAAESGAQRGMQALFLTNTTRQTTDSSCAAMAINNNFSGINGLQICSVSVTCTCIYQSGSTCNAGLPANYLPTAAVGVTKSFYTLTSEGSAAANIFVRCGLFR